VLRQSPLANDGSNGGSDGYPSELDRDPDSTDQSSLEPDTAEK
jgi:hypothetical protein